MKKNLKVILAFVLGIIVSGGVVYAANELLASTVSYDNTASGLTSTTVQGALDELNTKATTLNSNLATANEKASYIEFNSTKKIYVVGTGTNKAVCIERNGKISCFGINNFNVESEHLKNVFSDVSCTLGSDTHCDASDFSCTVVMNNFVACSDVTNDSYCRVNPDGSVMCN